VTIRLRSNTLLSRCDPREYVVMWAARLAAEPIRSYPSRVGLRKEMRIVLASLLSRRARLPRTFIEKGWIAVVNCYLRHLTRVFSSQASEAALWRAARVTRRNRSCLRSGIISIEAKLAAVHAGI
jgi:hypothetical protein